MENDVERVFFLKWGSETVADWLIFGIRQLSLKRTKPSIPYDQEHSKVFIQVKRVRSVMHPVMRGRYQNVFQPTHFTDKFRMYQNTPNLRSCENEQNVRRFEPCQAKRYKIDKPIQGLKHR